MTLHLTTALAIVGMALATYATRVAGLFLMRHVNVKGRTKAAFDALPPAILMRSEERRVGKECRL